MRERLIESLPNNLVYNISPKYIQVYSYVVSEYINGRDYNAPLSPFLLLRIDPNRINKIMLEEGRDQFKHSNAVSEVVDGNWHELTTNIEEIDIYRAIENRFLNGVPWEDTEFYQNTIEIINKQGSKWGCESEYQFKNRLNDVEKLYCNIRENGYKTQKELLEQTDHNPAYRDIHRYWPPTLNEVQINISCDGTIILHDGRHRFSIARVLNIDTIPVRVKARHERWQIKREKAYNSGNVPEEINNHPDIKVLFD